MVLYVLQQEECVLVQVFAFRAKQGGQYFSERTGHPSQTQDFRLVLVNGGRIGCLGGGDDLLFQMLCFQLELIGSHQILVHHPVHQGVKEHTRTACLQLGLVGCQLADQGLEYFTLVLSNGKNPVAAQEE
ncbi:hypothetical protein SDC9_133862 [bioreactor metagenome]|uniref:Uncharacterized protein n=1 Tax=bioreactor metagenome TaxID=1076179 RepID=A0A645DBD7_9ZZZZ